ncbi:MAG: nucleotide exchange factor GrpE [Mycoplasmataceae bacterium]|jgi:molecular chaperone GrpE|nr:nucleotide exchange factor GrpE [Mycoplasmataceae bacterium]
MSEQKEKVESNEESNTLNEKEKELSEQINSLKTEFDAIYKKNEELQNKIAEINANYAIKIKEKGEQANKIVQEKISELESKYKEKAEEIKKYGFEKSAVELVEIIDQFKKAINFTSDDQKVNNFLFGFKMFSTMFDNLLGNLNITIKTINVGDEFDPTYMDAFDTTSEKNIKNNCVSYVASNAYLLHSRVIKLASVKVNKNE